MEIMGAEGTKLQQPKQKAPMEEKTVSRAPYYFASSMLCIPSSLEESLRAWALSEGKGLMPRPMPGKGF